jgi:hypothetical protein
MARCAAVSVEPLETVSSVPTEPETGIVGQERNVFWTRSSREARRQKVLDELLELDPAQRRGRLANAVAAGDVHANEVDAALQLVHRLDLLRVMTIAPSGRLPGGVLPVRSHPVMVADEVAAADEAVLEPPERADGEAPVVRDASLEISGPSIEWLRP